MREKVNMTIVCPSCETRFRDPPADVLQTRTLQCSKCEHEWHVQGTGKPRITLDAPSIEPQMGDLVGDQKSVRTGLPVVMPKLAKRAPIYVDRNPGTSSTVTRSMMWPVATLAVLMVLAGSIGLRGTIMNLYPQSTALYQVAGLVSGTPGLEIGKVITTRTSKDGIRQLIVRGEIQNIADNTIPVPPVKLTMRGEANANLYAWTVTANKDSLKAGEKSRFTAVAHDFPRETLNVDVEFAPLKVLDRSSRTKTE
jgi:hypothetical protein